MEVALTNLKYSVDSEPAVEVPAGTDIKKAKLPKEIYDSFKESGAIGPPPPEAAADMGETIDELNDSIANRDARIAELEAALAKANEAPPAK